MLDTSVWVGIFLGDLDPEELRRAQGDLTTLTSPIVLAELESLSWRERLAPGAPADVVGENAVLEDVTTQDAIEGGRLHGKLRAEGHPKVGLGDCLIYATARRVGALLITMDGDLAGQRGVVALGQKRLAHKR
jgi:predicted nucleic acid-binding protein